MQRKKPSKRLSEQVKQQAASAIKFEPEYAGGEQVISTGSTLLDLAISGGRFKGGGLPTGILVEVFGPASCGKSALLCEIAGNIQRKGGETMFFDPEARLNRQYARMFGLNIDSAKYIMPDTVAKVFRPAREWTPSGDAAHGVFADSLAALSTAMELDDRDQYGMRRAKEFSEELRKTCRILTERKLLMVCSNQVRENVGASPYEQRYRSPGGLAIGFYASLRLRCSSPQKIKRKVKIRGKEVSRVIGVETTVEVCKSSIWKPFRAAPLFIIFDYGIDDIRANLQYVKEQTGSKTYTVCAKAIGQSLEEAIHTVEADKLARRLRREVISLWEEVEAKFDSERKPKGAY